MNKAPATAQRAEASWLARLPPGLFAIPFGLIALAGAWQRLVLLGITIGNPVSLYMFAIAFAMFMLLVVLWLAKLVLYFKSARQQWQHPVQGALLALVPMTLLLAIAATAPIMPGLAEIWLTLTVASLLLGFAMAWRLVASVSGGALPSELVTPALYLPAMGSAFVGALSLNALGFPGFAALLAGVGGGAWFLLETRVLRRLFAAPLPPALRSTVGIEISPAALASLLVASLWPGLPVAVVLLCVGIACVPLLAVLSRWRSWSAVSFSAGFWSFSFPLAALASAIVEAVRRGNWPTEVALAAVLMVSLVVAFLSARTLLLLASGRLLPSTE